MALNLKKKPQPLVKISLQMEQPAYETFSAFLIFLQEREQNPTITANEVINEIIREYLSGAAADVRGWREQQALGPVPAPKQDKSPVSKQNLSAVANQQDVAVSKQAQVAPAVLQEPHFSSPAPSPAAAPTSPPATSAASASSPAASPAAAPPLDGAPVSASLTDAAQKLEISPERQRQILHEEIKKKTASQQDVPKAT
jgi:hypothetical protein